MHEWLFHARDPQIAPVGSWFVWMILAGRGFGKTRAGAEWVRSRIKSGDSHIALVAETAADARDVMVEGESGILAVCWEKDRDDKGHLIGKPVYEPSKRQLTWQNGAIAKTYGADAKDQLRGPQHSSGWVDELAKFQYAQTVWDNLMFGLRLGHDPRVLVTTTPRPIPIIRQLVRDETTALTKGNTFDNSANLPKQFIDKLKEKYDGTRLGRQELNAEILDDVAGALWTRKMIKIKKRLPDMKRIVVAIDPSGARDENDEGADEIGIVVAGLGIDGRGYVLQDGTCKLSPSGWANRAVALYHRWKADKIIAERNYGGAMVKAVIRTSDSKVPYKEVTATRGKVVRAEPVSALYEQGKISHIQEFEELENQMCCMSSEGYLGEGSPDRVDALVWALTELMVVPAPASPLFGTYS